MRDPTILRVWTWPTAEGWETIHATFVAWSDEGDVTLSAEHTAFRWSSVDDYIAQWCHRDLETAFPDHAVWIRQVRLNAGLVRQVVDLRGD